MPTMQYTDYTAIVQHVQEMERKRLWNILQGGVIFYRNDKA